MNTDIKNLKVREDHKIFLRSWPVPNSRAVIVVSHGLGEHSGRYKSLAAQFNNAGYTLIAYDKGGHGQSSGNKGCVPDVEVYFEELDSVTDFCREQFPNVPLVLYGQSMGTAVGLEYVLRKPEVFKTMIASSGWIRLVKEPSAFTLLMAKVLGRYFPNLTLSNGLDPSWISSIPEEAQKYKTDPLVHGRISLHLGNGIFDIVRKLDGFSGTFPIPLLVMHSEDDPITAFGGSRDFVSRVEGQITFWPFKGTHHELHHDRDAKEIFDRQLEWLKSVLK